MEMKRKVLLGIGAASVVGVGSFAIVNAAHPTQTIDFKAESRVVDLSNATVTRRIWMVNQNNWSGWNKQFFVHAWKTADNTKNADSALAVSAYDTYYQGLFYTDVTFAGAGGEISIIIRGGDGSGNVLGWDNYNQTVTINLPSLSSNSGDVVWLDYASNVYNESEKRTDRGIGSESIKAAGLGSAEMAAILENYNSCEADYNTGYNAYPQLNKDFVVSSTLDLDTAVANQTYQDKPFATTIGSKLDQLSSMYNKYGWLVA